MERGGAEASESGEVFTGAVALVAGESVAGKLAVELDQQAVAIDLGDDTGGGDGEAGGVAVDDGLLGTGPVDGVATVDEEEVGAEGELFNGLAHGEERGLADVDAVDGRCIHRSNGPGDGFEANLRLELIALIFREQFRVGQATEAATLGKDDCCGDYWAEEGTAAYFVEAGDAEGAVAAGGFLKRKAASRGLGH